MPTEQVMATEAMTPVLEGLAPVMTTVGRGASEIGCGDR